MMHQLQSLKNAHFLQEEAAADAVEIAAAVVVVAVDVHSAAEAAAEVVHLLADAAEAADHAVAVKVEAVAVQAVHANLNNKVQKSPESLMRFRTFFVLWSFVGRLWPLVSYL